MKHALGICLLFFSISSHAEIRKWVDAEGKVHYSDMAPSDSKAKTIKSTGRSDNADNLTPATQKTLAEREIEWKKSQKAKEETAKKEAWEQETASNKQKNCENSRSNLINLENSPVIVSYTAQGERSVIDDAARKQKIEDARKAVSTYCN